MTLVEVPFWFIAFFGVAFGLLFGSFLNVVIHRVPRHQNIAFPASTCPGCNTPIAGYDNIPVLSWLILRGKARCCKTTISGRYPLVELVGGLMAWAVIQQVVFELPASTPWEYALLNFALYLAVSLTLVAIAFIDVEFMIIPDSLSFGGAVLGILSFAARDMTLIESLGGAIAGFLIVWLPFDFLYRLLRGHAGMGRGDAKLLMLAGAWFGWQGAVFALMVGSVQGTLLALGLLITGTKLEIPDAVKAELAELRAEIEAAEGDEKAELEAELAKDPLAADVGDGFGAGRLAFGPFLVLGILEYMLFGQWAADQYLNVLWL
ncbi:MAG: prepilin peptidase [Polyangiaceae bacterium]|nr:prepilin peptidase [Polyangiaceae bacterium]